MATTPISGLRGPTSRPGVASIGPIPARSAADAGATATAADDDDDAVSLDVFPSSPPDDLLAQIATASDSYDTLAEAGLHVSFDDDPSGRGLAITLQDRDGSALGALTPVAVLALAEGDHTVVHPTGAPSSAPARMPTDVDSQSDDLQLD